jgi:hypothetical protein
VGEANVIGDKGKDRLCLLWLGWIWVVIEGIGSLCTTRHFEGTWGSLVWVLSDNY